MRIGVIGGGIVGTAVAATLKQLGLTSVTIIDDDRDFQTSKAGQGYLWSVHRSGTDYTRSLEAKKAWLDLLGTKDIDQLFETKLGSLLVADAKNKDELYSYYEGLAQSMPEQVQWLDSVQRMNPFAQPSISAIHYRNDYTCTPTDLIKYLTQKYNLEIDRRTVKHLVTEQKKYDAVVCCAGPWINSLQDVGVVPVRGLLLKTACTCSNTAHTAVPMMEFGYGGPGVHFTLSLRGNQWLVGASRETVDFSTEGLDHAEQILLDHASKFVLPGSIGPVQERRVGFRPSCPTSSGPFQIKQDRNMFLLYGFEGQGVLYAALAAKQTAHLLLNSI